jgi:hypothetical protein
VWVYLMRIFFKPNEKGKELEKNENPIKKSKK